MPTWGEAAQILTALGVITSLLIGYLNSRKLEVVHKATNSMHDEIVRVTRSDAKQDGITEGRALQKADDGTT